MARGEVSDGRRIGRRGRRRDGAPRHPGARGHAPYTCHRRADCRGGVYAQPRRGTGRECDSPRESRVVRRALYPLPERRGSFTALEKWQTDYLPVYGASAALVAIRFPPGAPIHLFVHLARLGLPWIGTRQRRRGDSPVVESSRPGSGPLLTAGSSGRAAAASQRRAVLRRLARGRIGRSSRRPVPDGWRRRCAGDSGSRPVTWWRGLPG
jgi:hypothetical protein